MKKRIKILILTVIITGFVIPQTLSAQHWGGRWKPGFWDLWTINANVGLSSFFGDLSIYDKDYAEKFTKESGPALGVVLTKHINNKFGISGQLLYGTLKGQNNSHVSFKANFIEYNLHARVDFINLFSPDNISKFGIVGFAGFGQFIFKTTRYENNTNDPDIQNTGVPEFVYFGGVDIYYKVTDQFDITASMALRQARNDKLDDETKNENYDYYTIINIGVTYNISSKSSGSSRYSGGRGSGRMPMRRRR